MTGAPAGLILGGAAWLLDHQLTSDLTYARCDVVNPLVVFTIGLVCTGIAAVGFVLSWNASRLAAGSAVIKFTAMLGMLASAYSILVVAAGTIAGWLLPGCFK